MSIKILLIILGIVCIGNSYAQQPLYKHITTANNLPTNTIYEIYQDKKGLIWLGTEAGLVCYKGSSVQVFENKNSSKAVSNILEQQDGTMWCQSFSGQFYYTRGDSLVSADIPQSGNYSSATMLNEINLCYQIKNNVIIYNTLSKKIKKIDLKSSSFIPFNSQHNNHYYLYDRASHKMATIDGNEKINWQPIDASINEQFMYGAQFNSKAVFFTKLFPTQYMYADGNTGKTIDDKVGNKLLNNVITLNNNQLALLSNDGFFLMNNNGTLSPIYLEDINTSCILQDKNNNTWVGTLDAGLYIIPNFSIKKYFAGTSLDAIAKFNKQYIIGASKNEIQFINANTLLRDKSIKDPVAHIIKSIYIDSANNKFWYSNYQLNNGSIGVSSTNRFQISVNHITQADDDHLLLSESNCLSIFPIVQNDKWRTWLADPTRSIDKSRLVLNNNQFSRAYSAVKLKDTIFAATAKGVFKYYANGNNTVVVNNQIINAIQVLSLDNKILIVTPNQVLQYNNGIIKPFLYNNNVGAKKELYKVKVFEDRIYVLLYSGFDVFDKNGRRLHHIVRSDGFVDVDVTDFIVDSSKVITTTTDGVVTFPLDANVPKLNAPQLVVSKLFVNQKEFPLGVDLNLKTNQKFIEVFIDNCDYLEIEPLKQYYKINNSEWLPFKGNKITFNELAPGGYNIVFKAVNERGICSVQNSEVHFTIATPYYKTFWFVSSIVLCALASLLLAFRYRLRQINYRNKLLTDKIELEKTLHKSTLASIKAQMNPHFLFNALNTIQSYIFLNDKKAASNYLVKFSELTRLILDNSNKEQILLSEELRTIHLYLELEKMRFEDDFEYTINKNNIQIETIQIPSMLIQPYIENAIKHGLMHKEGKKILSLEFNLQNQDLIITIEDNGIGVVASAALNKERNQRHQSFANMANKKRIELLNEMNNNSIGLENITLTNHQNQVIGTRVIIGIPISFS